MISKEKAFTELLCYMRKNTKTDAKYPNWIFYFRNSNECYFGYNKEQGRFVVNSKVWGILKREYKMDYHEIKRFIKKKVETYFVLNNLSSNNPWQCSSFLHKVEPF